MPLPNGMAGVNGADILLYCNTGTDQSPVWTAVGSQRGVTFGETTSEIDASSKDSRNYRVIAGRYSSKLSMDALYVPDDASYLALKAAFRAGSAIRVVCEEEGAFTEESYAIITDLSREAPDQDLAVVSIEMTVDNGWTAVGT